ncbi:DNA methylase [Mediterraneibacter gnavus]|uniref:DNA methylase n=2 Tax=Mediterraneibacter gnavus TaxID=33038 RepID=A0A415S0Q6_MEDGN|nr:DNA methylase [Mediterraneibacter gnavus]MDU2006961.1 DNA methylase [Lachnospiraceae bacterium]RHM68499.1 DNA methylase [Mediterraneibacter gnavus]
MAEKVYIAIDLKSFYASVECMERGLNPMTTNLVVADKSRTEKTICLAVSPALKKYGIPGRPRLFEVVQKIAEINQKRKQKAPGKKFSGTSVYSLELEKKPELAVDYVIAPPQMAKYITISRKIYEVYLKYIAPEDMHVYSIDEVFIDATGYLGTYKVSARELARQMILDVLKTTGITATAGIGTNLYLCKVAMDIGAKHIPADEHGVRIAELDEKKYRQTLWSHTPLTDFWRVGRGYADKLAAYEIYTMGDIARCSIGDEREYHNEELLYNLFGVNAELLIDHAWGYEPCTMEDIKAYRPESNSIGSGQVLPCAYDFDKAKLVVREMADSLALELVDKRLVTNQLTLTVGYDKENLSKGSKRYAGEITTDRYGRAIPKHAHGTENLERYTCSSREMMMAAERLYDRIVNPALLIRRLNLTANHVSDETSVMQKETYEQLNLFTDYEEKEKQKKQKDTVLRREKKMQEAMLTIKKKYGKNAILKGVHYEEGATGRERNNQIGGHKA